MWKSVGGFIVLLAVVVSAQSARSENNVSDNELKGKPRSVHQLVSQVFQHCADMECVKEHVLDYLDSVLNMESDARSIKNIDAAIVKRIARVIKTHEFKVQLPESLFGPTDLVYNPRNGLNAVINEPKEESRGLLFKKKALLFPLLLLLKLKKNILMPIWVFVIGLKATKALILSKLAVLLVIGMIAYTILTKNGMAMPMSMAPAAPAMEPPTAYGPPSPPGPMYGPPSTAPPSSYEPGWEPNEGGPYARIWTPQHSNNANNERLGQNLAYSAYYPGSSSTSRP